MNANKMHDVTLPFDGFCDTVHAMAIDDAIERMFSNEQGDDCTPIAFHYAFNFMDTTIEPYCKMVAEQTQHELKQAGFDLPSMVFDEVQSPREYNFENDRIFIRLSTLDILMMFQEVDRDELNQLIKDTYTSYEGFRSFYDNSLADWCDKFVTEWDCNQLGTLMQAYTEGFKLCPFNNDLHENIERVFVDSFNPTCTALLNDFDYETAISTKQ